MRRWSESERLRERLVLRALGELSPGAESDRGASMDERPDDYELAAAAIYLALGATYAPMPANTRARVEARLLDSIRQKPE